MIKTLIFFIKVIAIVLASVWLISEPGEMDFNFLGYDVKIQTGVFLFILSAFILVFFYILKLIGFVRSAPKAVAEYREKHQRKRGYRSLTRGLVALAAGDLVKASQYSQETQKFLQDQNGLPLLLRAQVAKMHGDNVLANHHFEELMKDRDTAFLGIRGLMKSALDRGEKEKALSYARSALKIHSKQGWILKMVYMLECKNHHWDEVLKIGRKAEKISAVPVDRLVSDRIAIHLMRHDYYKDNGDENLALRELKQAYKLNSTFVPTVQRLSAYYIVAKKGKKASQLIEKAWVENPHPELAEIWSDLAPREGKNIKTKRLAWFEKLVILHPNAVESYIAAAKAAIDMEFWGEAKAYLITAEKIYPTAKIFYLRAMAEKNITHNDGGVEEILEKVNTALPDKAWVCSETGMVYEQWSAIAMPHESFNTMKWDLPGARVIDRDILFSKEDPSLILDPAA